MKKIILGFALTIFLAGCGYTGESLLPSKFDSIYVKNFINRIDPTAEVSDRRMSYTYWPGLENKITTAVIDKFLGDPELGLKRENEASMILKGELIDYRQYPLSYDKDDNVEEMRTQITVNLELYDGPTGQLLWSQGGFTGWATYELAGPNTTTEADGVERAVKDLSQRIVERVVEVW